ncbi:TadE/TadG family type IV pilus assembly protein [Altererythrobacter sp. ZODW24]|uniref:TadE/TadG family type IV pilus assembly protein n=1 Tax=Altererythrobacter sp. ZODW24 TaxID=2185142 RepID=UPI000DF7CF04|nr:TadE/TadG family type IV pilus assembly protein [Altererythrobacter sp. ZODW24]
MNALKNFIRNDSGGPAAEFALVLPIFIIFFIGIIDVGLYAWTINRAEKATQVGARHAVVTDMVASGLANYKFATDGGIPQGTTVPQSAFGGVSCTSAGCTCTATCSFPTTSNGAAFTGIVTRMGQILNDIEPANVQVDYSWSGLGFAGDPNGPDVAPIVTVTLQNQTFTPLLFQLFGGTVTLPTLSYSLTSEDGEGTFAN